MGLKPRHIVLALINGCIGVLIGISPFGMKLEEEIGLDVLFNVRGPVTPPQEAVVIGIDGRSSERLNVSDDVRDWDRRLHACLIDTLVRAGAAVIVFDIVFLKPHASNPSAPAPRWAGTNCDPAATADQDTDLEQAIARAGNVVLVESITLERSPDWVMERLVEPVPKLVDAALAAAPFPLPKAPARVSQFWAFKSSVADAATLPVVALQALSPSNLELFRRAASHSNARDGVDSLDHVMRAIRSQFKTDPILQRRRVDDLLASAELSPRDRGIGAVLRKLYAGEDSYYLNFYGPAATIEYLPYHRIIAKQEGERPGDTADLKDKVVFVGVAEYNTPQQTDSYYTVYSSADGIDLSGVEIAATAFVNLLTDTTLRIPPTLAYAGILLAFGCTVGILMSALSLVFSTVAVASVSLLYAFGVQFAFTQHALWLPAVVPYLVQLPFAMLFGISSKYRVEKRDKDLISDTLDKYVPHEIAEQILAAGGDLTPRDVTATILYSDIEGFTALSERMPPERVIQLLNEYFSAVSKIVIRHGGIIAQFDGDALLATFNVPGENAEHADSAVRAATEMQRLTREQKFAGNTLSIRVGINTGEVVAGNVGSAEKIQYTVHGDAVNVAARLEQYNKELGTRALLSEHTVARLIKDYPLEPVGAVTVRGRTAPLNVYKLLV